MGELPLSVSVPEPAAQGLCCSQSEDLQQLGEPPLHLPVPCACARLRYPSQRLASRTPVLESKVSPLVPAKTECL